MSLFWKYPKCLDKEKMIIENMGWVMEELVGRDENGKFVKIKSSLRPIVFDTKTKDIFGTQCVMDTKFNGNHDLT